MAAERDGLAAEYYSVTLADGIAHHLEGDYNRFNIAAAVAVGRYFDIDGERIRHAVGSYMPDNNRSQRTETERNTLIVDCYNANPSSMRASVQHRPLPLARGADRRTAPPSGRERLRAGQGFTRHRAGKGARRAVTSPGRPSRAQSRPALQDRSAAQRRNEEGPEAEGGPGARQAPERDRTRNKGGPMSRRQKAPFRRLKPHRRTRTA